MSKYHNKKMIIDGIRFDSKREAERYIELKCMEKQGEISELVIHPKFVLLPGFKYHGKTERAVTYTADFMYKEKNGNKVAEDVKGVRTEVFNIKRKFFLFQYGKEFDFRIVR